MSMHFAMSLSRRSAPSASPDAANTRHMQMGLETRQTTPNVESARGTPRGDAPDSALAQLACLVGMHMENQTFRLVNKGVGNPKKRIWIATSNINEAKGFVLNVDASQAPSTQMVPELQFWGDGGTPKNNSHFPLQSAG